MEVKRNWLGMWIPKEIWLDTELTWMEKLFLVEIKSLDNEEGCFASNEYLGNFFQLSKNRCTEIIKSLEKKGYITIEYIYKEGTKHIEKRVLRVIRYSEIRGGYSENRMGCSEKCEDNNITNNINNKYNYQEVIDYLNEKTGKTFKAVETNNKLIRARYNEGYTLEDFKAVIDYKTSKWKGTEWEKYLRPSTLFSAKNFENYVNEIPNRSIECIKTEPAEEGEFTNFLDMVKRGGLDE